MNVCEAGFPLVGKNNEISLVVIKCLIILTPQGFPLPLMNRIQKGGGFESFE